MSNTPGDTLQPWAQLADRLSTPVREVVMSLLHRSADAGRPLTDEGARVLVAYAAGHIDARTYATRTLTVLGFEPAYTATYSSEAPKASADSLTSPTQELPRESAVQAYVSGRITVEEFLQDRRNRPHR